VGLFKQTLCHNGSLAILLHFVGFLIFSFIASHFKTQKCYVLVRHFTNWLFPGIAKKLLIYHEQETLATHPISIIDCAPAEMTITWTILNQWEKRAMEGMLQALEPRVRLDRGPALSSRLQNLLAKRQASFPAERLRRKLKNLPEKLSTGE
jgi:hypothetical protein